MEEDILIWHGLRLGINWSYLLESVILASITLQLTYLNYLCITLLLCATVPHTLLEF
jgi:hypothetical protein